MTLLSLGSLAAYVVGTLKNRYLQTGLFPELGWPLPEDIDDTELEQLLYPSAQATFSSPRPVPDYDYIHCELRNNGVAFPHKVH